MFVFMILFLSGQGLERPAKWESCKLTLGSKPMVEITPMAGPLLQPDFVGALCDFDVQIRGLRRGSGVFCFLSRSVFHIQFLSIAP
jgi:hypothetical protein